MISICIPFRSDDPKRLQAFAFVIQLLNKVWPSAGVEIISQGSLIAGEFSRSATRNALARSAHGDILVFLDADSVVSQEQLHIAIIVAQEHGWCFPYDRYYNLTKAASQTFMEGGQFIPREEDYEYVFPGPDPFDRPASVGGCVVVSRAAFETVGGYDERFIAWGEEDRAFAISLETLVHTESRVPGGLFHLWHPAPESVRFDQVNFETNRTLCNHYRAAAGNRNLMQELVNERR